MGTWSNLKVGLRPEGRNDLCRMWAVSQASSEVLRDCGVRLTDVAGHNVTTGGGDVRGDIYQAGRDVVANFAPTNLLMPRTRQYRSGAARSPRESFHGWSCIGTSRNSPTLEDRTVCS